MKKLPKTIYVTLEKDGSEEYLLAWINIEDINCNEITGIYELKETGTIVGEKQFVRK